MRSAGWFAGGAAVMVLLVGVGTTVLGRAEAEPDGSYTVRERTVFVDACTAEGMERDRCRCLFDFISRHVPYADFAEADRSRDPADWPPRMRQATADGLRSCEPK